MTKPGGLEKFESRLNPRAVEDIRQWAGHPELGRLHNALDGHVKRKAFFDTYAEAIVARHLISHGCELQFEVPTPRGKACDFAVSIRNRRFFLHVKRADTERPARTRLTISSRLRYLERIDRPYIVSVRWREPTTDERMGKLVKTAAEFIMQASIGDELVVHDDEGREIGGVLIVAPWEGPHVSLAIGLPTGFTDETRRMRKLLRRAYLQFMPREDNVILVCSSHEGEREDFENALLGSHIERWDAFPPRGKRIAHGRAADGFWHGKGYVESSAAAWFRFSPAEEVWTGNLWLRGENQLDAELRGILEDLLGPQLTPGIPDTPE